MNQLVLRFSRSTTLSRRIEPPSPANMPREMSSGESSPPYEPSQPPTASTSTPNVIWISLLMSCTPINGNGGGGKNLFDAQRNAQQPVVIAPGAHDMSKIGRAHV